MVREGGGGYGHKSQGEGEVKLGSTPHSGSHVMSFHQHSTRPEKQHSAEVSQ